MISYRSIQITSLVPLSLALLVGCIQATEPSEFNGALEQQQSDLDRARERWQRSDITHYRFQYKRDCECTAEMTGPMQIEVRDGAIVAATYVDSGERVSDDIRSYLHSVDALFDSIQSALDENAHLVTVTYDTQYGFPAGVYIDYEEYAADEELSLTLSHFEARPGPSGSRYFEHPLYDNPADCPNDPLFNCTADLELCDDGKAFMLVTDIVNQGRYTETGATIATTWTAADVPAQIAFAVQDDGSLHDNWNGWTWKPSSTRYSFCD